jgi:hypothetical protein
MKHEFDLMVDTCKWCFAPRALVEDNLLSDECLLAPAVRPRTSHSVLSTKIPTVNQLLDGQYVQNVRQSTRTVGELAPLTNIKASR